MKYQLALCQMLVSMEKEVSLSRAEAMIRQAKERGANVIALPEMFNCPYANHYFREYAEDDKGYTVSRLSSLAKELNIWLIGGSIPELWEDKIYNTSYSFDHKGKLIGKHRKAHLFDIDVKGGASFKESDTLSRGDDVTVLDTAYGKIGVAICYDIRFPELFRKMALAGVNLVVVPGAFTMSTGPVHWELTVKARALDNQIYVAAISPARDVEGPYQAFANSMVANPWGELCGKTDTRESIVYGEIDTDYMDAIREQLPLLDHRRPELYESLER